jgi:hypothetical protein
MSKKRCGSCACDGNAVSSREAITQISTRFARDIELPFWELDGLPKQDLIYFERE